MDLKEGQGHSNTNLRKVLKEHLNETKLQVKRLEEIASEFNEKLPSGENSTVKDIIREGKKSMLHCHDSFTKDSAIIIHIQKIKHYEMASYGSLKAFAKHFKLNHVLTLLQECSQEEGFLDKKLTAIAEGSMFAQGINMKAYRKCA